MREALTGNVLATVGPNTASANAIPTAAGRAALLCKLRYVFLIIIESSCCPLPIANSCFYIRKNTLELASQWMRALIMFTSYDWEIDSIPLTPRQQRQMLAQPLGDLRVRGKFADKQCNKLFLFQKSWRWRVFNAPNVFNGNHGIPTSFDYDQTHKNSE